MPQDTPPVDPTADASRLAELHPRYARPMTMSVDCSTTAEHQLKKVVATHRIFNPDARVFELYAEEGPNLGGQGRHPLPLQYVLAGIGT